MARRVKQADGSYCYTENCRIHDRSGDSTGLQAVLNDAKVSRAQVFADDTSHAIQSELKVPDEVADRMGARVIETVMNSENGATAYTVAQAIHDAAIEEGLDPYNWDTLPAAYATHNEMSHKALIRPGDEVILNETGERGTITEGTSTFGGAVRFNPESIRSRNSFSWFDPSDVTKVIPSEKSLVREQIFAAPRDSLIPATTVKQLLDEETNKATRNAQGVKEVGRKGKVARENMLNLGDRIVKHYGSRAGMTKGQIVSVLSKEYERPADPSMTDAEVKATKSALRNIITYLDPNTENRS
jgi:hypothetical protein